MSTVNSIELQVHRIEWREKIFFYPWGRDCKHENISCHKTQNNQR